MRLWMTGFAVLAFWAAIPSAAATVAVAPSPGLVVAGTAAATRLPDTVRALAQRVVAADDHERRPFAIVDKRAARLVVYHPDGTLAGSTPVLLGRDRGDDSAPGVGERTQRGRLLPGDATTPAGRFVSRPGINNTGEAVVWVDPAAAFAIHRLRPGASLARRTQRLASAGTRDKRVSDGCVVVPVAFYETVVEPLLGRRRGVVYVIPEQGSWQTLWGDLAERGL